MGNRGMNPSIESVAMFTSPRYSVISSTLIREIALLGEDISEYVHPDVAARVAAAVAGNGGATMV